VNSGLEHEPHERSDWESWLGAHTAALLLFARLQCRSEADAQDLVQEAIVESWERQAAGTPPPLSLVYCTIRHRAIDLARSEGRRASRESALEAEVPAAWFDAPIEDRERARLLQEAMSALPDIYREVVTLKVWGGLTFAEIAEALQIPANTAASRYRYGLDELRKKTREILA
jgi:RNA polymerase sigma-70 factor, ECF subfamily